nr:hypothetical protein [Sphingomonas panacisoli]
MPRSCAIAASIAVRPSAWLARRPCIAFNASPNSATSRGAFAGRSSSGAPAVARVAVAANSRNGREIARVMTQPIADNTTSKIAIVRIVAQCQWLRKAGGGVKAIRHVPLSRAPATNGAARPSGGASRPRSR